MNGRASPKIFMRLLGFIPKKNITWLVVVLVLFAGITAALIWDIKTRSEASIDGLINYQAKLTDSSNIPVADGNYNLRFRICTDSASPCVSPIWAETSCYSPDSGTTCDGTGTDQRVAISNGFINVLLGQVSSLLAVDFNQTLYLEVSVGGSGTVPSWETLSPTKKLAVVPSAFESLSLGGKTESEFATLAEEETITAPWRFDVSSSAPGISINQSGSGYGFFVNGTSLFGTLGAEKITNGDFNTGGTWTYGTGWSYDATNLEADHTSGTAVLEQDAVAVVGETYYVAFEVRNRTAGSVTVAVGGASGSAISANGTSQATLVATTTGNLTFTPTTDFDGSIDGVSVKKLNSTGNMYVMGNLGIGTTSPTSTLTISSTDPSEEMIDSTNGSYTKLTRSDVNNQAKRTNIINALTGGALDSQTVLMLHMNSDFTDNSASNHVFTVQGDVHIDGSIWEFGNGSGVFDGSGDYLTTPNSTDFDFETGDFTIDFWIYPTGDTSYRGIIGTVNIGDFHWEMYTHNDLYVRLTQDGASSDIVVSTTQLTLNEWNHVALVRKGTGVSDMAIAVNGSFGTWVSGNVTVDSAGHGITIGRFYGNYNDFYFSGNIDELRISKGIARWITDFTPPDSEYGSASSSNVEVDIWKSTDSAYSGENGIQTFGDLAGRMILQGKTIRFNIGSSEKIRVDENGNLGVGTTLPAAKADILGTFSTTSVGSTYTASKSDNTITATVGTFSQLDIGKFFIWGDGTVDIITVYTDPTHVDVNNSATVSSQTAYTRVANFYVASNGNVGIGTANPTSTLTISSADPSEEMVDSTNGSYTKLTKSNTDDLATRTNRIFVQPAEGGGIDSYTKLILHMNGTNDSTTFLDSSLSPYTVTANGGAKLVTAVKKFGTASGYFDGDGDYLSVPDSDDWDFGSDDFTIDFWVKKNANNIRQIICGQSDDAGSSASISFYVDFMDTNQVRAWLFSVSGDIPVVSTGTITDTTTFHHIAFVRDGNTLRLFIDGVPDGTADVTGITPNNSSNELAIGRIGEYDGLYLNGWLDEFRISKGIARWTSDFSSSLPSSEYGPGALFSAEVKVWQSQDSVDNNVYGIQTFGDSLGGSVLQGKTIRFNIGASEKIRIDENGNLGIGTTTPDSTLHVIGGVCIEGTDSGCAQTAGNLKVGGTIEAVAGFKIDGTAGLSRTLYFTDQTGLGTCSVVVSGGIITSSDCN